MAIEDIVNQTILSSSSNVGSSSSAQPAQGSEIQTWLSSYKLQMLPSVESRIRDSVSRNNVDITVDEVKYIAVMSVELAAVGVLELFSPTRFTDPVVCIKLGLRPGLGVDFCERKPYGSNEGEFGNINKPSDVKELKEMVDFEEPYLLTGSPQCDQCSQFLKISAHRRDPIDFKQQRDIGTRNPHTAVDFHEHQLINGHYFLHEHPEGADSWEDKRMIKLQNTPGVYTGVGPMCHCELKGIDRLGNVGIPRKCTRWVTNSFELAKTLDVRCRTELGNEPHHVHHHLINGLAAQAAKYPLKLIRAVLNAIRKQMKSDHEINEIDMKFAGPGPAQELFDDQYEGEWIDDAFGWNDNYNGDARYYDDISGVEFPVELIRKARQEELGWVHGITLYDKVPRRQADDVGVKPITVRWVDVNKGDDESMKNRSRLVGREFQSKPKKHC